MERKKKRGGRRGRLDQTLLFSPSLAAGREEVGKLGRGGEYTFRSGYHFKRGEESRV